MVNHLGPGSVEGARANGDWGVGRRNTRLEGAMAMETQEVAATLDDIIPETQYDDADVERAVVVLSAPSPHTFRAATTAALPLLQHRQPAQPCAATDQGDDEETAPFLSSYIPSRPLAQFWRPIVQSALRLAGPGSVDRLFVNADGSCAGGAFVLALADPAFHLYDLGSARSATVIASFRTRIAQQVASWTAEQWVARVPEPLRLQSWSERLPCQCANPSACQCLMDAVAERDLFVQLCSRPNYAVGQHFFHIAAIAMQVGVLLLVKAPHEFRAVFDFGTTDYSQSIIIYSLQHPHAPGQQHHLSHFETVGLRLNAWPSHQAHMTVFPREHPLLRALQQYAGSHCDRDKTLSHEFVCSAVYAAPLPTTSARPAGSVPNGPVAPLASSLVAGGDGSQRTTPRQRTPSARAREAATDALPHRRASSAQDTLEPSRAGATKHCPIKAVAAAPQCAPDKQPSAGPRNRRAIAARGAAPRPPVAAGPPRGVSHRQQIVSERVLSNVRDWVRRTARCNRLASRVHFACIPLWTLRCQAVLQALVATMRAQPVDERSVIAHLCALWMLPAEVFSVPARSGGGKSRRKNRQNRIQHKLQDVSLIRRLMDTALQASAISEGDGSSGADAWTAMSAIMESYPEANSRSATDTSDDSSVRNTADSTADARTAQRAQRHFELGHAQKAMQTLASVTELADLDIVGERRKLSDLHPQAECAMPVCPADAPEVAVDFEWMQEAMRLSDTGAAEGPSGWGSNYLSVLADDPHCVQAMAFFVQQIVNNRLPSAVRTLLTTSFLVSLGKDDGGRRPIAIGDLFYRLASRYVAMLITKEAQRAVSPHQYGAGQPDGCTQVVQSVQHLLADSTSGRPMACLSVDMVNAFNSVDRAAMLRAVYSNADLCQCWRAVDFAYGLPSLLLMQCDESVPDSEAFIESQMGVRQGDPLTAMLFCLVMHPVYDAVARTVSGGCFAFVDDGNFVGTVDDCWRAWQLLPQLLDPLHLGVNAGKSKLTCFHLNNLQAVEDALALRRFQETPLTINTDSVRLLGCVVARDTITMADHLKHDRRFRVDQLAAFRRLKRLSKQTGMLALQRLTGTVLTNRLRAMPLAATLRHARQYDARVRQAAHSLIGITAVDGDTYDIQLRLPLSLGGFGLTSAADIAAAAYLAGAEITLRLSPVFSSVWSGERPLNPSCGMYAAIDHCLSQVAALDASLCQRGDSTAVSEVCPSILPADAASFASHFRVKPPCLVQSSIIHRITTLVFIARVTEAAREGATGVEVVARMYALRAAESWLWLQTLPVERSLALSDTKWQWAARFRLGMPNATVDAACLGCKKPDAYLGNSWHSLACVPLSGTEMTDRHNKVLNILAQFCRLMLVSARTEPAELCHDSNKRPDIQVDLPDKTLLSDVTITHPSTKAWRTTTAHHKRTVEPVGDKREADKNESYLDMADSNDMEFIPFVLYTYGGFHSSALAVVNKMVATLEPARCLLSASQWKHQLMATIAIAVQRGNADIMIKASQRLRETADGRIVRGARLRFRQRAAAAAAASKSPPSTLSLGNPTVPQRHDAGHCCELCDTDAATEPTAGDPSPAPALAIPAVVLTSGVAHMTVRCATALTITTTQEAGAAPAVVAVSVCGTGSDAHFNPDDAAHHAAAVDMDSDAAVEGPIAMDLSQGEGAASSDRAARAAVCGAVAAATTDEESASEASSASDTGSGDGDEVLSDAVTAILDCSSSSVDVADDDIAATDVVAAVPVLRQHDTVADADEDPDDRVPLSELRVTWSSLMEGVEE
jgi:hypothetical protein